MRGYFARLTEHPGVPIALGLQLLGAAAGADRGLQGALVGAAMMSVFWIPVLLSNRHQPQRERNG